MLVLLNVANDLESRLPNMVKGTEVAVSINGVAARGQIFLLNESDERHSEVRSLFSPMPGKLRSIDGGDRGFSELGKPTSLGTSEHRKKSILTPREAEVLRLSVEGISYEAMAARLAISVNTVRYYIRRLHLKLDAHNRTAVINEARRLGLV